MVAQSDWFMHSALLWTFPPTTALVIAPAAPAHPTGGGGTFCVRLGMYVSPRVKILGGVGVQRPTHPRAGTRVRATGEGCGARVKGAAHRVACKGAGDAVSPEKFVPKIIDAIKTS